jgi:hypothetical protein
MFLIEPVTPSAAGLHYPMPIYELVGIVRVEKTRVKQKDKQKKAKQRSPSVATVQWLSF